jgi:hypothetical protein
VTGTFSLYSSPYAWDHVDVEKNKFNRV